MGRLGEIWDACRMYEFGRGFECLGEVWSAWERFGALGRVLERLGEFWSTWEGFGVFTNARIP